MMQLISCDIECQPLLMCLEGRHFEHYRVLAYKLLVQILSLF